MLLTYQNTTWQIKYLISLIKYSLRARIWKFEFWQVGEWQQRLRKVALPELKVSDEIFVLVVKKKKCILGFCGRWGSTYTCLVWNIMQPACSTIPSLYGLRSQSSQYLKICHRCLRNQEGTSVCNYFSWTLPFKEKTEMSVTNLSFLSQQPHPLYHSVIPH